MGERSGAFRGEEMLTGARSVVLAPPRFSPNKPPCRRDPKREPPFPVMVSTKPAQSDGEEDWPKLGSAEQS